MTNLSSITDTAPTSTSSPDSAITAWSPAVQSTLDRPPSQLPYRLLTGGITFCIAFGIWAYVGKIEEVSSARGQLIPQGEVYKVMPVKQGKVLDILVKEGEPVQAGQAILKLDDQLDRNEIERLEQALEAAQDKLSQTQALVAKTRLEIQTRQAGVQANSLTYTVAIEQAKSKATTTQALTTQIQTEITAHQERIQRLHSLQEHGAISQEYFFNAEQSLLSRQQAMTQYEGDLQGQLSEIKRLKAEQKHQQADGKRHVLEVQQRLQQLEVETTQLRANILEIKTQLRGAYAKLGHRTLEAPVDGVVLNVKIANPDEVVDAGQPIAEIAPKEAPLILFAKLANRDAGFVQAGMTARIKFDAYPFQDYGVVDGTVVTVAPDAVKDEKLGEVYEVEIALLSHYMETEKGPKNFKPGQTATVDISLRRRRVINILIDPFKQLNKGGINL
ncbi:HlyD family efflux transporter periplasmic adaptor subunit [Leptothoe sp. LEGE 181152]|nr:HlyD family efflux transporter periplasmic adaptor subunit [Leptothoe sp. LEGE 181152]